MLFVPFLFPNGRPIEFLRLPERQCSEFDVRSVRTGAGTRRKARFIYHYTLVGPDIIQEAVERLYVLDGNALSKTFAFDGNIDLMRPDSASHPNVNLPLYSAPSPNHFTVKNKVAIWVRRFELPGGTLPDLPLWLFRAAIKVFHDVIFPAPDRLVLFQALILYTTDLSTTESCSNSTDAAGTH